MIRAIGDLFSINKGDNLTPKESIHELAFDLLFWRDLPGFVNLGGF
jgi:hypothetical protein